jgi:hypothetical protein
MQLRLQNIFHMHLRLESGWYIDSRILDVTFADTADSLVFVVVDVLSRKVICSSRQRDGIVGLIDVLSRAIRKHGAPSQFICDGCRGLGSKEFIRWLLLKNIGLYVVPPTALR